LARSTRDGLIKEVRPDGQVDSIHAVLYQLSRPSLAAATSCSSRRPARAASGDSRCSASAIVARRLAARTGERHPQRRRDGGRREPRLRARPASGKGRCRTRRRPPPAPRPSLLPPRLVPVLGVALRDLPVRYTPSAIHLSHPPPRPSAAASITRHPAIRRRLNHPPPRPSASASTIPPLPQLPAPPQLPAQPSHPPPPQTIRLPSHPPTQPSAHPQPWVCCYLVRADSRFSASSRTSARLQKAKRTWVRPPPCSRRRRRWGSPRRQPGPGGQGRTRCVPLPQRGDVGP